MTTLYVDTSALLKRLFLEDGSDEVRSTLRQRTDRGDVIASSELAWVEVARAVLRAEVGDVDAAVSDACSGVARHPLSPAVMSRARRVGPPVLRSLDAIHLAAAVDLDATDLLTFDRRLADAAQSLGLHTIP